jgi:hypothetical protein
VWLIACLCQWNGITGLAYAVLKGVFYGGLYQVFLKRIRGQQSAVGETFSGFSQGFAQLLLAGAVSALLGLIATWCCFVIPGLYLLVAWIFCVPLVADKRLEFWSGMELSRKMVTKVWFQVFGLVLIAFSPYILMQGFTSLKIGMMVAAPLREVFSSGQPDISVLFQAIIRAEAQVFKTALPLLALTKLVLLLNLPFAVGALMYAYEDLFGARPTPAA